MNFENPTIYNSELHDSLLQLATPYIYEENVFHSLNCSPLTSEREIKKKIQLLKAKQSNKSETSIHSEESKYNYFKNLESRIRNPETRIIDEFFAYWSNLFSSNTHQNEYKDSKSVQILISDILKTFREQEPKIHKNHVVLHDFTIYVHNCAIQLEKLNLKNKKLDQFKQSIWKKSLELWKKCYEEEAIWSHMRQRIHDFSDPRLTTGTVRRLKATLLPAIYSINFHFFHSHWKSQNHDKSLSHKCYLRECNAQPAALESSFRIAGETFVNQINHLCNQLDSSKSQNQDWQTPLEEFQSQISDSLTIVQEWLPESSSVRKELLDSIASSVMKYTIKNCLEKNDYQAAVRWLQYASELSTSSILKQRIEENLNNAMMNQNRELCWFCENYLSDEEANLSVPLDATFFDMILPNNIPVESIQIPRCAKCKLIHMQQNKYCLAGPLFGLISGLLIASLIPHSSITWIVVSAIVGSFLGYGLVYLLRTKRTTQQTKPYAQYKEYPAYKNRMENLNFNHPPSNEFPRKV